MIRNNEGGSVVDVNGSSGPVVGEHLAFSGIRVISAQMVSADGRFVGPDTGIESFPSAEVVTAGHPFPLRDMDEETSEILRDDETMSLIAEAEKDVAAGRTIDGDKLRNNT